MRKSLLILVAILVLLPATATASPDTAPILTWELALNEPTVGLGAGVVWNGQTGFIQNPCNLATGEATRIVDIAVAKDGHIYTLEECQGTSADWAFVRRIDPNGQTVWTRSITSMTAGKDISPVSIHADPASRAWVWYDDQNHAPDSTTTLVVIPRNDPTGADFVRSNTQFASTVSIFSGTFNETGPDSFAAFFGGGATRLGYTCTGTAAACTETFEMQGEPGSGNIHHGAPYSTVLYGHDLSPTSENQIINQATGAIIDSEASSAADALPQTIWVNAADVTRVIVPYYASAPGDIRWEEFNATTLASIRTVDPIEQNPYTYDSSSVIDFLSDGNGNVYSCGEARTGGVKRDSHLSKYNNTATPGMRWNITWSKETGDSNLDAATACALGDDGAIYVGTKACANLDTSCRSYLRKYGGAGVGRSQQTIFDAFTASTTTTAPGGNVIAIIRDNVSEAWGFDWGWLIGGIIVGIFIWKVRNAAVLVVAIMAFIGVGFAVALGMIPEWFLFVLVLIIIAVAGTVLTRGGGDDGE